MPKFVGTQMPTCLAPGVITRLTALQDSLDFQLSCLPPQPCLLPWGIPIRKHSHVKGSWSSPGGTFTSQLFWERDWIQFPIVYKKKKNTCCSQDNWRYQPRPPPWSPNPSYAISPWQWGATSSKSPLTLLISYYTLPLQQHCSINLIYSPATPPEASGRWLPSDRFHQRCKWKVIKTRTWLRLSISIGNWNCAIWLKFNLHHQ